MKGGNNALRKMKSQKIVEPDDITTKGVKMHKRSEYLVMIKLFNIILETGKYHIQGDVTL